MTKPDLNTNAQLVEELAQALATDDPNAARVATVVIVGKVLDLFERHVKALESIAQNHGELVQILSNAQIRADYGIYVKMG